MRIRDAAIRRLRLTTALVTGAAGALALVFGLVAAKAFPGRSTHVVAKVVTRRPVHATKPPRQTAPSLVSAGSPAQPQSPSAPAPSAPAPAVAPPVAVSGGS